MLELLIPEILDDKIRENFQRIENTHKSNPVLSGRLELREYTFLAAVTRKLIPHGLDFLPQDVLLARITGAGTLTIHYDKIDRTNLELSTTGPCVVRLILGSLGT